MGADCIEKEMRAEHVEQLTRLLERAELDDVQVADFRRYGSPRALQLPRRQPRELLNDLERRTADERASRGWLARRPARVRDLRPRRDRRDPARRARGDLRHPRLRRQAPRAAFRRLAVPRRVRLALSARGLSRALRHRRRGRGSLRARAAAPGYPDHDRGNELRRALGGGEGGARARRQRARHEHHDRRRRHDTRGARALWIRSREAGGWPTTCARSCSRRRRSRVPAGSRTCTTSSRRISSR